jgi:hypothetical protein
MLGGSAYVAPEQMVCLVDLVQAVKSIDDEAAVESA